MSADEQRAMRRFHLEDAVARAEQALAQATDTLKAARAALREFGKGEPDGRQRRRSDDVITVLKPNPHRDGTATG
jgi:hypothetical protein